MQSTRVPLSASQMNLTRLFADTMGRLFGSLSPLVSSCQAWGKHHFPIERASHTYLPHSYHPDLVTSHHCGLPCFTNPAQQDCRCTQSFTVPVLTSLDLIQNLWTVVPLCDTQHLSPKPGCLCFSTSTARKPLKEF